MVAENHQFELEYAPYSNIVVWVHESDESYSHEMAFAWTCWSYWTCGLSVKVGWGGVSMMHDVAVPIDDECEAIRLSRNVVGRLDMILEDDADLVATVVFMPKSVGMDWRQWRHCEFRVRSLTNHLQDKPRFSKIPTNRISSTTQARTFTRSYLTSLRPQNTWAYLGIPLEACIYPLPQAIIGHSYSSNADVVAVSSTSN